NIWFSSLPDKYPRTITVSPLTIRVISFFIPHTTTTDIYTLSLHDALPILMARARARSCGSWRVLCQPVREPSVSPVTMCSAKRRSEEHTSELQSLRHLVCRLLLENKNIRSFPLRRHRSPF